jgi:nitrate/nitrite-specific signal transduction histidine kinase
MSDVVQSVRQLLQDFIAPELRELKSDVKQVDSKIDLEIKSLKAKIDSDTSQLRADFRRLEDKVDSGFAQMRTLLENAYLRSELEATRDISNLRERVTRLEVERGSPRQ